MSEYNMHPKLYKAALKIEKAKRDYEVLENKLAKSFFHKKWNGPWVAQQMGLTYKTVLEIMRRNNWKHYREE